MEEVLNNLLLLVEANCNEGVYIKAGAMIKTAYEIQNNSDSDSDSDDEIISLEEMIYNRKIEELEQEIEKDDQEIRELIQKITRLSKEVIT